METWQSFLNSDVGNDIFVILDVMNDLAKYTKLDISPFLLACLEHSSTVVRSTAIDILQDQIENAQTPNNTDVLRDILTNDPDPVVRGSAAYALGHIARKHNLPWVLPLLLSVVTDPKPPNEIRLLAYKGLIYLKEKWADANPKLNPWNLRLDESADEQIDWDWIKSLEHIQ
jgi:HEAT repeat protein